MWTNSAFVHRDEPNIPTFPTRRSLLRAGLATAAAASCCHLSAQDEATQRGGHVTPEDYSDLTQLVMEMMWRIDHGQASNVHELFVSDGTLTVSPLHLRGSDALLQWGKDFDAHPTGVHHVVTNLRFIYQTPSLAEGTSTLISFQAEGSDGKGTLPAIIGMDRDILVRTGSGWRFKSRTWEPWLSRRTT
jgi:SnoaL-like domain